MTPNTPQSTKKIEERFDDVLQNLDESYTRYYMSDFLDTSQEFEHPAVTILNTKQHQLARKP